MLHNPYYDTCSEMESTMWVQILPSEVNMRKKPFSTKVN